MAVSPDILRDTDDHLAPLAFDIEQYLESREQDSNFVMVEIGHGGTPVAYQQTAFRHGRVYIGVEAWLRDPWLRKRNRVAELQAKQPDDNIFYIDHDLDGEVVREDQENEEDSYYIGDYHAATLLPNAVAREVFLSNVFSDRYVAWGSDKTEKLLSESARLISDQGMVVSRETITPQHARLGEHVLEAAGLQLQAKLYHITKNDALWQKLERVYDGEPKAAGADSASFYVFMSKLL